MGGWQHRLARHLPTGVKKRLSQLSRRLPSSVTGIHRDQPSMLAIGEFDGFTVAYRGGTADENVLGESFDHDQLLRAVPEYRPSPGDVVIDIGAHIGTFSLLVASRIPGGTVHAIEASLDTFNLLRINAALNRAKFDGAAEVHCHHLAISDREGTITLYHDVGNWGHSTVARLSARTEEVPCCTLADFMSRQGVERCQFIKFNCEGAEFPILLGSPREVLERIDTMLVLYHGDLWRANTDEELLEHLRRCGFDLVVRNKGETRGWIVATRKK